MMKYIVLFSVVVAVASAFVCPPNFCSGVKCDDLSNCLRENGQKIREKGSFCKCCDICVKVLGEGERCMPDHILGSISASECDEGLACHRSHWKCVTMEEFLED
uniref:Cystine knot toxin n=2 Tax=Parasteatoda tepidariorum TaxID=114398 RepID=A0A2L2Y517_PARTP